MYESKNIVIGTMLKYSKTDFNWVTEKRDGKCPTLSRFDSELCDKWDEAMHAGVFRYKLNDLKRRIIKGERQFVTELNVKRASERRKAQPALSVNQPFNPDLFNFNKIRPEEVLFVLERQDSDSQSTSNSQKTSSSQNGRNLVIVNVSPLAYGHVLIVPDVEACRPQVLTEQGVKLAIETMLLSSHRGFRICFNSICALASVNHHHLHAYYLDEELFVESCVARQLKGAFYEAQDIPVPAYVFQLHGNSITKLSRYVHSVGSYLARSEIAHNVFMTRGQRLDDQDKGDNTIRIFIFPRKHDYGEDTGGMFNVAAVELAGHIPVKVAEGFEEMTEGTVEAELMRVRLSEELYNKITKDLIDIMGSLPD